MLMGKRLNTRTLLIPYLHTLEMQGKVVLITPQKPLQRSECVLKWRTATREAGVSIKPSASALGIKVKGSP